LTTTFLLREREKERARKEHTRQLDLQLIKDAVSWRVREEEMKREAAKR
jgi:hypothetical protein